MTGTLVRHEFIVSLGGDEHKNCELSLLIFMQISYVYPYIAWVRWRKREKLLPCGNVSAQSIYYEFDCTTRASQQTLKC